MNIRLLSDNEKTKLTADDLFDRVINLKIKVGKKATKTMPAVVMDEFVIRSDYEIVYSDNALYPSNDRSRRYIIRKCTYKPSIKVNFNMTTANTGTEVDIFLSNFYVFTSDGNNIKNFDLSEYTIVGVDVAMGYWGQFKNSINPDSEEALDAFYNITAPCGSDMLKLSSDGIYVKTDKLPPDSMTHIHGFVADVLTNPVAVSSVKSYDEAVAHPVTTSGGTMDSIFFNYITKRYIKGDRINRRQKSEFTLRKDKEEKELTGLPKIDPLTGQMGDTDAKNYGVQVYLSEGVSKVKIGKVVDSDGTEHEKTLYFEAGWTIGQTLQRIFSALDTSMDYKFTNSGDLLIYTASEASDFEKLAKDFDSAYEDTVTRSYYGNQLPAVYKINIDALATITCPFFTFIEPFQRIEFASRYALTSLVSYYASYSTKITAFIATKVSVAFATVENVNEVTIVAVSEKEGDV